MHGAIADGERVDLRLADEIDGGEWVGVGARGGEHVSSTPASTPSSPSTETPRGWAYFIDLAGELDVLLEGKRRARPIMTEV